MTTTVRQGVPVRVVGIFLLVSFGVALMLDAVAALTGGLGTPHAKGLLALRMFTPALASWMACRFVTGEPWLPAVGLSRPSHRRGWLKILAWSACGVAIVAGVTAMVLALATGAGWLVPDWGLTSLMDSLRRAKPEAALPPPAVAGTLVVVSTVIAAYTVNGLLALGEEAGWRGWLQSALAPLGRRIGVVATGAIWGLWHAPLIVMGYEYGGQIPVPAGIVLFTCVCIAVGVLLSWLRARSGSVIPGAVAHGAFNGFATLPLMLVAPGGTVDMVTTTITGWPSALLFGLLAACFLTRRWGRWT